MSDPLGHGGGGEEEAQGVAYEDHLTFQLSVPRCQRGAAVCSRDALPLSGILPTDAGSHKDI